jgi:hypothetical protein
MVALRGSSHLTDVETLLPQVNTQINAAKPVVVIRAKVFAVERRGTN